MFEYLARAIRVLDGDTIKMRVDLGLRVQTLATIRLALVSAPELRHKDGRRAKEFVEALVLPENDHMEWPLLIQTFKDRTEKYGRWLARVTTVNGARDVAEALIAEGLGEPWKDAKRIVG